MALWDISFVVWWVFGCSGVVIRRWWMRKALCRLGPSQLQQYQSFRMFCCSSSTLRLPHWVSFFLSFSQRRKVCSFLNFYFSHHCLFIFILNDLTGKMMLLKNSTPLHSPLQRSPGTKANEWSSPTWSFCSASSFVTTSFPTTSTCAHLFPAVTWPLIPTCLAHVPPVTSLRMNQSAKIRRPAATARTRQVGGSCCDVRWLGCAVWCGLKKKKKFTQGCCWFNRIPVCQNPWK